jgi:hypothetical protein
MEYYETNRGNPNILLRFLETKFVNKNVSIQQTFEYIFSHGSINYDELKSVSRQSWRPDLANKDYENQYEQLLDYIKKYNWKAVDALFLTQYNTKEHFRIIFALLTKWHYHDKIISRLQYENTLGIQQARWAISPENKFIDYLMDGLKGKITDITFNLVKNIDKFPFAMNVPKKIQLCFYQYSKNKIIYTLTNTLHESFHMGIPETFNLSKCAPVYRPRLVLGTLNSCSLLKFMKNYGERPFICHHPDLSDKHNSIEFDGIVGMNVFEHWAHDARHVYNNIQGMQRFDVDPLVLSEQQCLKYNDDGYIYNPLNYQQQTPQTLQDAAMLLEFSKLRFDDQFRLIKSIKEPLNLYSFLILEEFREPIMPYINKFRSSGVLRNFDSFDDYVFSVFYKSLPVKTADFDEEKATRLLCHPLYVDYYNRLLSKLLSKDNLKRYLGSYLTYFKNHLDFFETVTKDFKIEIFEKIKLLQQKL